MAFQKLFSLLLLLFFFGSIITVNAACDPCNPVQGCYDLSLCSGGGGGGTGASGGGWNVQSLSGFGLPDQTIYGIIVGVLQFLLIAIGLLGIISFAIAGILYLTSAGDEDQIKRAKKAMNYAIIGVIVAIVGFVAIRAADNMLRGNIF